MTIRTERFERVTVDTWKALPAWKRCSLAALIGYLIVEKLFTWHVLFYIPRHRVRGRTSLWAVASLVDIVGPVSFFRWGIKRSS